MPDLSKRLFSHIDNWRKINAPSEVLHWIEFGTPITFTSQPPEFCFENKPFTHDERLFLRSHIARLVKDGAVRQLSYKPRYVSSIKTVPKKPGSYEKYRMITNLFFLNQYVITPKFQYDSFNNVAELISYGDHFTSFDLKDGFYHVPLSPEASEYMGFQFENKFYTWIVCPFGWSSSPYYFHKIVRPLKQFICLQGIRISVFVDDAINIAPPSQITDHTDFSIATFEDSGFVINYPKSKLDADHSIEYTGYIYDSMGPDEKPWVYISKHKVQKLIKDAKRALRAGVIHVRFLAKICGQGIAMAKAILPAKFKLRPLYSLLALRQSWSHSLILSDSARAALLWWTDTVSDWNGSPLHVSPVSAQVSTDSSGFGWGAVCHNTNLEAAGSWDLFTANQHINFKELLAILYAVLCFKSELTGKTVQFLSDSSTAVSYIRNMGGPIKRLSSLAEVIWEKCYSSRIHPVISHLSGKLNCRPDSLSRLSLQYEWMLDPGLFNYIDSMLGPHTVDRFASMTTALLPKYNSRFSDPLTSGVDALAQQDWGSEMNFVNAPFRLLNKVLDVVVKQRAHATVIAPHWPNQPWFSRLKNLSVSPPIRLRLNRSTILPLGRTAEPLKNRRWQISAWRIFGG